MSVGNYIGSDLPVGVLKGCSGVDGRMVGLHSFLPHLYVCLYLPAYLLAGVLWSILSFCPSQYWWLRSVFISRVYVYLFSFYQSIICLLYMTCAFCLFVYLFCMFACLFISPCISPSMFICFYLSIICLSSKLYDVLFYLLVMLMFVVKVVYSFTIYVTVFYQSIYYLLRFICSRMGCM